MQNVHGKVYCIGKLWDNLEPIVHFTMECFSPVAADEVTERADSAGDVEEEESSSVRSSDSEEDEPDDPRVQEKVGSRNEGISTEK